MHIYESIKINRQTGTICYNYKEYAKVKHTQCRSSFIYYLISNANKYPKNI